MLYQPEKLVLRRTTDPIVSRPTVPGSVAQQISTGGHEVVGSFEVILSELSVLLDCTM